VNQLGLRAVPLVFLLSRRSVCKVLSDRLLERKERQELPAGFERASFFLCSFPLVPSCLSGNSRKKERVPVTDKHSRWNRSRKRQGKWALTERNHFHLPFSSFFFSKGSWGAKEERKMKNERWLLDRVLTSFPRTVLLTVDPFFLIQKNGRQVPS